MGQDENSWKPSGRVVTMNKTVQSYRRGHLFIERLVQNKLFWFLSTLLLFSYPIFRSINRELPPPLPRLHQIDDFSLTNEFNKPFGSKDIKGKITIASFMFTSCPTTCPGLMKNMQTIQKRVRGLGQNIALATFSVDPENDTPQVLHEYARSLRANPYVWNFLTGTQKELRKVLIEGFKVPMGDGKVAVEHTVGDEIITLWDIVHTEKLVLLDGDSFVRGYYSVDKESLDKLMIDVGLLYNRSTY